jgi:hypothetical protein
VGTSAASFANCEVRERANGCGKARGEAHLPISDLLLVDADKDGDGDSPAGLQDLCQRLEKILAT